MSNQTRKENLSKQDHDIIRSFGWLGMGGYLLFLVLFGLGCFLIYYGIFIEEKLYTKIMMPVTGGFFFIVIPGVMAYYLIFMKIEEKKDIDAGNKEILRGRISDKQIRKRVGTDSSAEPGGFIEQVNHFHYFVLDDVEFMVDKETYKKYEVGDLIDIHYIPSTRFFIRAEKVLPS